MRCAFVGKPIHHCVDIRGRQGGTQRSEGGVGPGNRGRPRQPGAFRQWRQARGKSLCVLSRRVSRGKSRGRR